MLEWTFKMKRMASIILATLLLGIVGTSVHAQDFNCDEFNNLSEHDKLSMVIAGLRTREAALQNHQWQISEKRVGNKVSGDVVFETSTYDLQFDNRKL